MAIQKNIELNSGFTANYIKIERIEISHVASTKFTVEGNVNEIIKQFKVVISIYKDALSRQNKSAIEQKVIYLQPSFNYIHNDVFAAVYTLLKATPEFSGAVDV